MSTKLKFIRKVKCVHPAAPTPSNILNIDRFLASATSLGLPSTKYRSIFKLLKKYTIRTFHLRSPTPPPPPQPTGNILVLICPDTSQGFFRGVFPATTPPPPVIKRERCKEKKNIKQRVFVETLFLFKKNYVPTHRSTTIDCPSMKKLPWRWTFPQNPSQAGHPIG
jgi:hypothetical protein